jgi:DNA-binding transcriptional MocR family regulator
MLVARLVCFRPDQVEWGGLLVDEGRAFRLARQLKPLLGHGEANQAVATGLRSLILDGRLVVGARVASERDLSASLGVSRSTVSAAYRRLRNEGYLVSDHGGGTRTAIPAAPSSRPDDSASADLLDLTIAAMQAPSSLPDLVTAAALHLPSLMAGHGLHPLGLPALRDAIAGHHTARGLRTSADQILVTQGALHGWDLLLRTLTGPGDRVLIESPSYPAVVDAAAAHRVRIAPIGVSPSGWDLSAVRPARGASAPVLAHVTPDHQNPTGWNAPTAARRELLQALPPTTLVIADETFRDLTLDEVARPSRPLGCYGGSDRVITVGSLSKSVWAGLRIGWIRASPELVRRVATGRTSQDLSTPVLEQLVAEQVLTHVDALLEERHELLRHRRTRLLAALAAHAPDWRPTHPAGGLVTWVDLGQGASSTRLADAARRHGVRVTPGTRFTYGGTHDRFLRLPYTLPEDQLVTAVERLAAAEATVRQRGGTIRSTTSLVWTA